MLTRRQIRVKVMQCIYALIQAKEDDINKQKKFLKVSIDNMYTLYLTLLSFFMALHKMAKMHVDYEVKKYLKDNKAAYPNPHKFVQNNLLNQIVTNTPLKEAIANYKLDVWHLNEEYVKLVYKEMVQRKAYQDYMLATSQSYDNDRNFIIQLFKEIIAPNDKLYDYFEDEKLTWLDDLPIVNTFIVKRFKKANAQMTVNFLTPNLLKDQQDLDFANTLLTKVLLNNNKWESEIEGKTPNWDKDRIAEVDFILLKMAICELLNFTSIPEKVTLNEYLEIAKEYSTPKSSIFINGILDKLVKEYRAQGKLNKMGRGLL